MDANQTEPPGKSSLWIIWGALLSSLVIYGVVLQILEPSGEVDASMFQTMLIAFSVISLSEIGIIFFVRRLTFFDKIDEGSFEDRDDVAGQYSVTCILTWALSESVAIYGFVLSFLSGDITYYLAFGLLGAVLMIGFRPQYDAHVEQVELAESETGDDDPDAGEW